MCSVYMLLFSHVLLLCALCECHLIVQQLCSVSAGVFLQVKCLLCPFNTYPASFCLATSGLLHPDVCKLSVLLTLSYVIEKLAVFTA